MEIFLRGHLPVYLKYPAKLYKKKIVMCITQFKIIHS